MKYQMPEPFRKQGQQLCNDGNTTVFFDAYTAAQMHEAFNAGRAAGLEAAASIGDVFIEKSQYKTQRNLAAIYTRAIRNIATNLTTGETK